MCETYLALPDVDKFEIPCAPNLGKYILRLIKNFDTNVYRVLSKRDSVPFFIW